MGIGRLDIGQGISSDGNGNIAITSRVNVKTFGAVGDGVTDDTVAIQAAIDSLANASQTAVGEGRLYIPGSSVISLVRLMLIILRQFVITWKALKTDYNYIGKSELI